MRCATVTIIHGFADAGTTRATYQGLTVGDDGALSCPVGQFAVIDSAQWAAVSSYSSFTDLSAADAGAVAVAIATVWAIGWAFRMVIRAMNSADVGHAES